MLDRRRKTPFRDLANVGHPVAAGARIFRGALVALNAAGFLVPGTATAGLTAVGCAEYDCDNREGADGERIAVVRFDGAHQYLNDSDSPVTRTDIGSECFILDDQTVSALGTDRSPAGQVVDVGADGVWVRIV